MPEEQSGINLFADDVAINARAAQGQPSIPKKRHDWIVMYNALVAFGAAKNHCNVPLRHERVMINDSESVQLGAWLATQRREHLGNSMKPDRRLLMQNLVDDGLLEWAPLNHSKQSEKTWPLMFECLKVYCLECKSAGKDLSTIPEGLMWTHPNGIVVGIGRWMHTQNKQRRAGKLRGDRATKMDELIQAGLYRWPSARKTKLQGGGGASQGLSNPSGLLEPGSAAEREILNNGASEESSDPDGNANPAKRCKLSKPPATVDLSASEADTQAASASQLASIGDQLEKSVLNTLNAQVDSRNTQVPLTTDAYARHLAGAHFAAAGADAAGNVSLVFPLPQFRLRTGAVPAAPSASLGHGQSSSKPTSLVVVASEPSPQLLSVPVGTTHVTADLALQLEAQAVVYLALQSHDGRVPATDAFLQQLARSALEV